MGGNHTMELKGSNVGGEGKHTVVSSRFSHRRNISVPQIGVEEVE